MHREKICVQRSVVLARILQQHLLVPVEKNRSELLNTFGLYTAFVFLVLGALRKSQILFKMQIHTLYNSNFTGFLPSDFPAFGHYLRPLPS